MNNNTQRDELEKLKIQYQKERKHGFIVGIIFVILSIFFTILGLALQKYAVFGGVLLTFIAGIGLILNNKE